MKRANANIGSHSRRLLTTVRNNFSGSRAESEGWMRDSAAATSAVYGGSSGAMRGAFGIPVRRRQQVQFIDPVHGRTPDSRGSAAVLAIIDTHTYRPTSAMSSTISAGTRLRRSTAVVAEVSLRAST